MHSLIQARIKVSDDLEIKTLDPIPSQRDYVINILREEYPDEPEASNDGEDIFIRWREKLERLENLHYYEFVYFWDIDFLHLDYFVEEELLAVRFQNIWELKISGTRAENLCCPWNGRNNVLILQAARYWQKFKKAIWFTRGHVTSSVVVANISDLSAVER